MTSPPNRCRRSESHRAASTGVKLDWDQDCRLVRNCVASSTRFAAQHCWALCYLVPQFNESAGEVKCRFDARKSRSNKKKHGIDFVEVQSLWNDPDFIVIPARSSDEPRALIVGKIEDQHWSGIITSRGDRIRIISVRRSRKEEVGLYES